jgi:hypothetical protein
MLVFAIACYSAACLPSHGQQSESKYATASETLAGHPEIRVVEAQVQPDAVARGITQEFLKSATEKRLRRNGVPFTDELTTAVVEVSVDAQNSPQSRSLHGVLQVRFIQEVTLSNGRRCQCVTWRTGAIFSLAHDFRDAIRGQLNELVDKFSDDWLEANADDSVRK